MLQLFNKHFMTIHVSLTKLNFCFVDVLFKGCDSNFKWVFFLQILIVDTNETNALY